MENNKLEIFHSAICSRGSGGLQEMNSLLVCGTPLEKVYIGCPKQVLVLAGCGDREDYENIFSKKIVLVL